MLIELIQDTQDGAWSKGQRMFVSEDADSDGNNKSVWLIKSMVRIVTLEELSADVFSWPKMTAFESKIFDRFVRRFHPPYHQHSIQLEGDGQVAAVLAWRRMKAKGILNSWRSCEWYLSDLGQKMAFRKKLEMEIEKCTN